MKPIEPKRIKWFSFFTSLGKVLVPIYVIVGLLFSAEMGSRQFDEHLASLSQVQDSYKGLVPPVTRKVTFEWKSLSKEELEVIDHYEIYLLDRAPMHIAFPSDGPFSFRIPPGYHRIGMAAVMKDGERTCIVVSDLYLDEKNE